jgi:PAS domain S-box-containing protein
MAGRQASIDLTRTLENVKVPSFVADADGTITWLNDAARRTFGDLAGRRFTTVVPPEYVGLVERQLERKLQEGAPVTVYEVDVLTADGRRRRAEISSVPIESGDRCHAVFGVALAAAPRNDSARAVSLTARQSEVLHLLSEGASTDQIAAALHLSRETVRNHIRNTLRALGAHSRLEAVAVAHRRGLLRDAADAT